MFFTALLLFFYWKKNNELVNKFNNSNKNYKFKTFGILSALFLVIHSMLHILGYAHEDKNDAILMESKEIEFLSEIGVKDPYK